jgi:hypothetical protein
MSLITPQYQSLGNFLLLLESEGVRRLDQNSSDWHPLWSDLWRKGQANIFETRPSVNHPNRVISVVKKPAVFLRSFLVREEYPLALQSIREAEEDNGAIIVLGHSGIGEWHRCC